MDTIISSIEIGMKIKECRLKAGLTQERLAELVGVTFQQIQKYENGTTKLNTDRMQTIAAALSVPVTQLIGLPAVEPFSLTTQEQELVKAFRELKNQKVKDSVSTIVVECSKKGGLT